MRLPAEHIDHIRDEAQSLLPEIDEAGEGIRGVARQLRRALGRSPKPSRLWQLSRSSRSPSALAGGLPNELIDKAAQEFFDPVFVTSPADSHLPRCHRTGFRVGLREEM